MLLVMGCSVWVPVDVGHDSYSAGGLACDVSTGCIGNDSDPIIDVCLDVTEVSSCGSICIIRDTGWVPGMTGVLSVDVGGEVAAEAIIHCVDSHDLVLCKFIAEPGLCTVDDSVWCDPIANVTVSLAAIGVPDDLCGGSDDSVLGASCMLLLFEALPGDDLSCTTWVVWPVL